MLNFPKLAALGALLTLGIAAAAPASAAPVTFVFSGLGTGIVHGNGFNSAPFSFSYVTDTSLFSLSDPETITTAPYSAPVSVYVQGYGFGSGTSTNAAYFFARPSTGILGLTDAATSQNVFVVHSDNIFGSGPIPITLADRDQYPLSPFETSIGEIQFAEIHDATFSGNFAPVPEASSVVSLSLLLALGAGAAAVSARRKKARTLA